MAHFQPFFGGDFGGDGADHLLWVLARVVGMDWRMGGWWMGLRCVVGVGDVVVEGENERTYTTVRLGGCGCVE